MTGRKHTRRSTWQEPDETPVVLPHVVITATDTGALNVTIDGSSFPAPQEGGAWTRGTFGRLLDAVTQDRTIAVRIEVREVDGTVFTDIIRARRPTPHEPAGEVVPETRRARRAKHTSPPVLVEVTGDGFVPGEDVALAVIVSHTDATGTGSARALLDTGRLTSVRDGTGEVVLYGRISGTTHVRRLS